MRELSIDIETYSGTPITLGAYAYADDPDFEVLLFAYSWNRGAVEVVDLAQGEEIPADVEAALLDGAIVKTAYNANFERTCLARHFGQTMPPHQWRCTMVDATRLGLPAGLAGAAAALKLDDQKDKAGTALIKYFCVPSKPTQVNGERTRNLPHHEPERWAQFIEYCRKDVEVEVGIREKIEPLLHVPEWEQDLWALDQQINDRGILVDQQLVSAAVELTDAYELGLKNESCWLTGLENPNSTKQLGEWLELKGYPLPNLRAATVEEALQQKQMPHDVRTVLLNRIELSKAAVTKYIKLRDAACQDDRLRGVLQFYGASRTGRWAGRIFQPQNLTKNKLKGIATVRDLIREEQFGMAELLYNEGANNLLSQLVRTALVASAGHTLYVSDFSAIEARVIAWLAGEQWRLDVFAGSGKIYEASASAMFGIPIEKITKDSPVRSRGKVAELALGYQGGPGALKNMGALDMGIEENELRDIVAKWRKASPHIVQLWKNVENSALKAVREKGRVIHLEPGLAFHVERGVLFITLPSGRRLAYPKIRIVEGKFGGDALEFDGPNEARQWGPIDTYGGKLVENITQAVARDCLGVSMLRVEAEGYDIILHVHDELVTDTPIGSGSVAELEEIMGRPIDWAPGLPLAAAGFESPFYMKD